MIALAPADRREQVRELYGQGLSLRQVGARLEVEASTVYRDLVKLGAPIRRNNVTGVRNRPRRRAKPGPRQVAVPLERAAIAYSADRGWHMTQAPPGWFLDLLEELN